MGEKCFDSLDVPGDDEQDGRSAASGMLRASGAASSSTTISVAAWRCRLAGWWRRCGCWSRCARWRRWPRSRRTAATAMLAMPWPISSWFESCACRHAVGHHGDSSDSMAPSIAIVKPGHSWITCERQLGGSCSEAGLRGMPPKALPMVATPGSVSQNCRHGGHDHRISGAGTRARPLMRGADEQHARLAARERQRRRMHCGSVVSRCQSFSWKCGRNRRAGRENRATGRRR